MAGLQPVLPEHLPSDRVRIGDCTVEILSREIVRDDDGHRTRVTFKSLGVLFALIAQDGEVVGRERLLQSVWPNTMPTEDVLNQAVTQLRRAFGDDADRPRYIRTIARTGYRLLADVEWLPPQPQDRDPATPPEPPAGRAGRGDRQARGAGRWARGSLLVASALVASTVGLSVPDSGRFAKTERGDGPGSAELRSFQRLTSRPGVEWLPTLSPDGAQVVYSSVAPDGSAALMLQATAQAPPRTLTRPGPGERDVMPTWSPDGREIAFARDDLLRARCRILLVPVSGGAEREAGSCLHDDTSAIAWHPEGKRLIADGVSKQPGRHGAIETLDLGTGEWTSLRYQRRVDDVDMMANYSPDGRWIAFQRNISLSDIWLMPASGGTPRRLTRMRTPMDGLAWGGDSRTIVFSAFRAGAWRLYAVGIDGGEARDLGAPGARRPAAALRSPAVAFTMDDSVRQLHVADASAGARPAPLFPSTGDDLLPSIAPDGRQLVFVSYRSGRVGLWWGRVDDPQSLRLIEGVMPVPRFAASWSDDGHRVLVIGEHGGRSALFEVDAGSGRASRLPVPEGDPVHAAYLSDRDLLVIADRGDGRLRLSRYDRTATPWRRDASIDNVAFVRVDPAGTRVLFTRPLEPGVWQADPGLREISRIGDRPGFDGGRRLAFVDERALLGESDEGCGLRWTAVDEARPGPPAPCMVPGDALHDVSIAANGTRMLFSLARQDRDVAIATLSRVRRD